MKRILILVAITLFVCLTASAFQGGGGEATKKKADPKKKNSGTKAANTTPPRLPTPPPPAVQVFGPGLSVDLGNGIKMEFVRLQAGSFQMGSEDHDNEKPMHRVTISQPFYMGKYEVTQGQWQAVMGTNPSNFKGENLPVQQVSWLDAQEFIRKLNGQNEGYTYRLPTEAEWEYACRAGTTGDYAGDLDAMAWFGNNAGRARLNADEIWRTDKDNYYERIGENGNQTHAVGTKQANGFGLYDMHGNVWEWCEDWYHDSYAGAPTDGSAWLLGGEQKSRVLRGGSWGLRSSRLRSALRSWSALDGRYPGYGFRAASSPRT